MFHLELGKEDFSSASMENMPSEDIGQVNHLAAEIKDVYEQRFKSSSSGVFLL